jgi:hypothetical protein
MLVFAILVDFKISKNTPMYKKAFAKKYKSKGLLLCGFPWSFPHLHRSSNPRHSA